MRFRPFRVVVLSLAILMSSAAVQAGTVHGTVKNGTTGQPAAGVELTLVQPMGGMQELAHAKSGPQGEFTFDNPNLGTQPMLVRAAYHGINFNSAVPPGSSTVQVDIFEPSKDPKTINVPSHVVIFQPNGTTLLVGEEYQIENKSQPPQAYYKTEGNFDFALPENGQLKQVSAAGPAGMPVVQLPIDKKKNRYSIAFAFRPGVNVVRYSYELPYEGNAATVRVPTVHAGGSLLVVAPPTVQVSGDGLAPGGQEQGMNLYGRQDVPAGTLVAVNLSGTAPPANVEASGGQGQQGGEDGVNIQAVPGRLDDLKWPLLGLFFVAFAAGGYLLSRKAVVVPAGAENADAGTPATKKERKQAIQAAPAASPKPTPPASTESKEAHANAPTNGPSTLKEVDAAIGSSLDALKESLFRLELRRQAGTISEEEYARERARAEKVLRDLVRG